MAAKPALRCIAVAGKGRDIEGPSTDLSVISTRLSKVYSHARNVSPLRRFPLPRHIL